MAGGAGTVAARAALTGLPDVARIAAAIAPQTTRPTVAMAAMPVRKLTSSSQAFTAPRNVEGRSRAV
jgi:hypothetical protein